MITSLGEIKTNSKNFKDFFERIKEKEGSMEIFKKEVRSLFLYMKRLGIDKDVIKIILEQLKYHGFEKFFLGYNSSAFSEGNGSEQLCDILILGEIFTNPIIFMDDALDSHLYRNGKPTLYNYFSKKNPVHKKENTIFISNILLNYLIHRLFSTNISTEVKINLLENYFFCVNKTYLGGISEQNRMPSSFEKVLEIYKMKSHYFTTYFISKWGSILAGADFDDMRFLPEILLYITYIISLRNDVFDFVGRKRDMMEDLLNYSNPIGLFLIGRHENNPEGAEKLLESGKKSKILRIIRLKESKKIIIGKSFNIRNHVKLLIEKSIKEYPEKQKWLLNYLLYTDFLLKDLLDNLNYV